MKTIEIAHNIREDSYLVVGDTEEQYVTTDERIIDRICMACDADCDCQIIFTRV